MKTRLIHPLWVHLPAVAAFVFYLVSVIMALPFPENAAVHFGPGGTPDRYGSPWETAGIIIGISLLFIGLSVFFDELWARQEKRKSFNWLSLLDDVVVGFMLGTGISYISFLTDNAVTYSIPWSFTALCLLAVVVPAVILEFLRRYRPYRQPLLSVENAVLREEVARTIKSSSTFVYWDYQNPWYISLLTIMLPLVMFGAAAASWMEVPWVSILLIVVGLALVIPYGGQRTLVTRDAVTVRWGIFGIPVLRLGTSDIAGIEFHEFSPLRDFGGYGIRFNSEMKAYFLRGRQGVKFTLRNGKKYLIGSDRPADLLAVAEAITGAVSPR